MAGFDRSCCLRLFVREVPDQLGAVNGCLDNDRIHWERCGVLRRWHAGCGLTLERVQALLNGVEGLAGCEQLLQLVGRLPAKQAHANACPDGPAHDCADQRTCPLVIAQRVAQRCTAHPPDKSKARDDILFDV
ncbi:hypothetical protein Pgy4_28505 [Pseudomonas savastanoi pv. glycinea str. race 4]|uniref:Uncharacterized protein n=1 Tax=Pseudomonas savastanoi pv. glycinea str. race 4 TaxID=875330 RepID=F3CCI1_PSESG|nr:hypothetical protein Pgy4_28505 [Pseudomonas savastanoi pv. glycinea str. race 4]